MCVLNFSFIWIDFFFQFHFHLKYLFNKWMLFKKLLFYGLIVIERTNMKIVIGLGRVSVTWTENKTISVRSPYSHRTINNTRNYDDKRIIQRPLNDVCAGCSIVWCVCVWYDGKFWIGDQGQFLMKINWSCWLFCSTL